jgi:3-hydroxyisobutyrate dehydrogenase-like beta-hydroxyacid dehydrogenase
LKIQHVGILHPGKMGISVAVAIQTGGHTVHWVSAGRSSQSRERAQTYHLQDASALKEFCQTCAVVVSVCPPHAAEDVAAQVAAQAYRGVYVDANAISPQRAARIGELITTSGGDFVDGGIVGGPVWEPGKTWLYLSGKRANEVAQLFKDGPMGIQFLGEDVGQASALKMCYAAYTKGSTALLCAILAAAEKLNVRNPLEVQWSRNWEGFAEQTEKRVRGVTAKAWRFEGEMREIAATFVSVGLPGGFHQGAEQIYQRMAQYKDAPTIPPVEAVLAALLQTKNDK